MFPQIFGKYVLERELASGGMARVYLATLRGAVGFEKRLVLKQIRPELSLDDGFVRRFVDEAKIAVELSHPNIVPVYELGVEAGVYYMAMELCEGLTLTEVLGDTGPLDAAEGAYLGIEICRALDYAHRKGGIVHRDVTPRNVLLDEEGAVRLIDFGIAAPATTPGSEERVEVFGSPGHMPPEQIGGDELTPATDVFAVAVLLIEAWTGRPPFRRESFHASAEALKEPVPSLAIDHPELAPVAEAVARALSLSVAERPQDAEALGRKLREFSRQFDSGDVAKRLGARVQKARRGSPSSSPWLPGDGSAPMTPADSPQALLSQHAPQTPATPPMSPLTPATPPGAVPVTRTFAASPNLVEWTRRVSTPPPATSARDASDAGHAAPSPLASSSPPLIDAGPESDNLATRRLPSLAQQRSFSPWGVGAGLALVAVVVLAMRGGTKPSPAPAGPLGSLRAEPSAQLSARLLPAVSAEQSPSSPPSAGPKPSNAPQSARGVASALSVASSPTPFAPASASRASSDSALGIESAVLRLTADPEATVTVLGARGAQTQVTPVRALKLAPGAYTVTFRSATFGEPVVARLELAGGASRSVHADFRAAIPTVVVR